MSLETPDSPDEPSEGPVAQYWAELRAYFTSRWRVDPDSAQDLAQSVYARLLSTPNRDSIRNPKKFLFWLARKVALSEVPAARAKAQMTIGLDGAMADESLTGEFLAVPDGALREVIRAEISRNIDALDPDLTVVVRLRLLDGLSIPEIAAATQLSEGVIKWRYTQGLKRLRELSDRSALRNP